MTATPQRDLPVHRFAGAGGTELAYREFGTGRHVVLIHGLFSNGPVNWIRYGHSTLLAAAGRRVIMPDLRAHGASAHPHDDLSYPPDVLVDDGLALIAHLGLADYDLGGYSLGARTAARMMVRGARPRRAVLAGTGLAGLISTRDSRERFRHVLTNLGGHPRGSDAWRAEAFLRTVGGDPTALLKLLDTFVDTAPHDLARITIPTLVVVGSEDRAESSADDLAAALRHGTFRTVPGDHMSAVSNPALGQAISGFIDPS